MSFYDKEAESFKLCVGLLRTVGKGLLMRFDCESAEAMFFHLLLTGLMGVGEN